ncbi:MAG: TetR/AcrR family transcriptional regulator C-terminal domain-containing protein [Dethiobacteria bacterium]
MIKGRVGTKLIISQSLIELLKHTSLNNITIQKIVDNCGFTRQTFYLHFKDKYDLSYWMYKKRNDIFVDCYLDKIPWQDILCKMLIDHNLNEKIIRGMMDNSEGNFLRECIHTYAYDTYFNIIKKRLCGNTPPNDFVFYLKLYSCGSAEMTFNWIRKGMQKSPQYIAKGLMKSMNSDLKSYLSLKNVAN